MLSFMLRFIAQPSGPVTIIEWTEPSAIVFAWADRFSRHVNLPVDINAIDNGTHSATTLHGQSRAWDLDTGGDRSADLHLLFDYLRGVLPPGFDVVLEPDHVHVEWQPKR